MKIPKTPLVDFPKTILYFKTEQDVDKVTSPVFSFYSPKNAIQSLVALPEVKESIKNVIRNGKEFAIERNFGGYYSALSGYNEEDHYNRRYPTKDGGEADKGIKILNAGLDMMELPFRDSYFVEWSQLNQLLKAPISRIRLADRARAQVENKN